MPRRTIEVGSDHPLLDIASYARPGPGRRDRLSAAEIEHISLTVNRAPEVMIKVLTKGGQDLPAVQRHIGYIGRHGDLEIEADDGRALKGRGVGKDLLEDWDLDLEDHRRHADLAAAYARQPARLVHKLIFSMPPGTPPDKVLTAVRNFAREQFALKHRYAMVLHTDEPQPHVHMVVKAVGEQGERLNIRKATLREWRREFARYLRAQGVEANATERAVRGENRVHKSDGIFRAALRGDSSHMRARLRAITTDLSRGRMPVEPGKSVLMRTRKEVERGWRALIGILAGDGHQELKRAVSRFVETMPPLQTENEALLRQLLTRSRESGVAKATTR